MASSPFKNFGLFLLGLSPAVLFLYPTHLIAMGGVGLLMSAAMLCYLHIGRAEITFGAPRHDPAPKAEYLLYFPSFLGLVAVVRDRPLVAWTLILPTAAAAFLVTLVVAIAIVRGRQTCGVGTYFGLTAFAAIFGSLLACFLNSGLDPSPGQTSTVRVVRHYRQPGKSTPFHLEVSPFPAAGRSPTVTVSSDYYDHHPVGSSVQLMVHPGLLGAAWFQLR